VFLSVKLGGHLLANLVTPYEFHRDELLYLAMGTHLRILHMDFPPLIALLGNAARAFPTRRSSRFEWSRRLPARRYCC